MDDNVFTSYVDSKTQYILGNSIEEVVQKLENASKTVFKWFTDNYLRISSSEVCITVENEKNTTQFWSFSLT